MKIPRGLRDALKQRTVVLFVGSGVSANLGLPSWGGLIDSMAGDLKINSSLFARLGSFPELAEYHALETGGRSSLARKLQASWQKSDSDLLNSATHSVISTLPLELIYTTNYDDFIERSLELNGKSVRTIITPNDMITDGVRDVEVIKFHGDLKHPESMVVSEADYFERLKFEAPLDVRLRADLLRYNFLFIGYSLSDTNIRNMLFRLNSIRQGDARTPATKTRSFIFTNRLNPVQSKIFESWGVETVLSDEDSAGVGLLKFLNQIATIKVPKARP